MAAEQGGTLLFGFNATDGAFEAAETFAWPLSPVERIETVQQDFLDLMVECQVEHIRCARTMRCPNAPNCPLMRRHSTCPVTTLLFAEHHS